MNPKISIIVPVYNVEKYLNECLDSLLNQTFKNFEVIIVNDGSSDDSFLICKQYADKDNRFILINQQNKGLSGARNTGINNAKAEYILFLDSDDYLYNNSLEKLIEIINKDEQIDVLIFNLTSKMAKKFKIEDGIIDVNTALHGIYENSAFVTACTKLYKKDIFNKLKFKEGIIHEDEFICHRIYLKANKIYLTNQNLYFYREVQNSITTQKLSIKHLDVFYALDDRIVTLKEADYIDILNKTYDLMLYLIVSRFIKIKATTQNDKEKKQEIETIIKKYENEIRRLSIKNNIIFKVSMKSPNIMNFIYSIYKN